MAVTECITEWNQPQGSTQGVVIKLGNVQGLLNKLRNSVIQGPPIAGSAFF